MPNAYCTKDQLKAYLSIDVPEDDDLLNDLIVRATAIIERKIDRVFQADTPTTRFFDPTLNARMYGWDSEYSSSVDRGRTLWFDRDICQINSITNGDNLIVNSTDYITKPANDPPFYAVTIKQNANSVWSFNDTPENSIAVVGYWAYSKTPPLDIVHATVRLVNFLYRQKDNGIDVDRPIMSGDGLMAMPVALPKDVFSLLTPYMRLV